MSVCLEQCFMRNLELLRVDVLYTKESVPFYRSTLCLTRSTRLQLFMKHRREAHFSRDMKNGCLIDVTSATLYLTTSDEVHNIGEVHYFAVVSDIPACHPIVVFYALQRNNAGHTAPKGQLLCHGEMEAYVWTLRLKTV